MTTTTQTKFGFIRTTLALWAANLFPGRAGVVTDAPVGSGTSETWGWYDGSAWKYAAKRGGSEAFTDVILSGLSANVVPRLDANKKTVASAFGDDGSTATCTRPLTVVGSLALNGVTMPGWVANALVTMIGHTSFIYSYDAAGPTGVGSPTIGRNFYIDGSGSNAKAQKTASGSGYPAYLQIEPAGNLVYGTSVTNPTAGAVITDLAIKWSVSKEGGTGFFGVAAPTTRPTVNAACTDLATCIALTNQLRTHLIACGLVQ